MRYNSGRGGSLIKELDVESQMESQIHGLLLDLMETDDGCFTDDGCLWETHASLVPKVQTLGKV